VDVHNAIGSEYPPDGSFKLYRRLALCLCHLGRHTEAIDVISSYCSQVDHKEKLNELKKELNEIKKNLSNTSDFKTQ
jgi:hypothetical protein